MEQLLFVLNNMNIGGTEKAFLNLIETLPEDQYDISVLLLEKSGGYLDLIPKRVSILIYDEYAKLKPEIMDPPLQIAKKYLKQKRIKRALELSYSHLVFKLTGNRTLYYETVLKGFNLDIEFDKAIAFCGPFDFISVLVLKCIKAKEKVQWIHFDVNKFHFNTKTCRKLYSKYNKIYVVSDAARESLVSKIPEISSITSTKINVVSEKQCRRLADEGNGFDDSYSGIRIITVGRLSFEKGQDIIPIIASELKLNGMEFRWYLVGDGKLKPQIEQLCKEYNVSENIFFLGTQINPYQYLKEADIYVQTSIHEGYCITLAEAKVFGLPIVSTDCAGAHEQLDSLNNCVVVDRNVADIRDAILKLTKKRKQ